MITDNSTCPSISWLVRKGLKLQQRDGFRSWGRTNIVCSDLTAVIIMITGNFLGMSVTTDNVRPSSKPSVWQIDKLTKAAVAMGLCFLASCTGSLLIGKFSLGLGTAPLQSLCALTLIFGGKAILYCVRERRHLWKSLPSRWMAVASVSTSSSSRCSLGGDRNARPLHHRRCLGLGRSRALRLLLDFVKVPVLRVL